MKEKLILMSFGLILGLAMLGVSYPFISSYLKSVPAGASFDTVEDFQRAMLQRDDRDIKPGSNVSLRTLITPHPNEQIMYDLIPNQQAQFQDVPVRMNSCGMRGQERSTLKPEKTFRIAFLGDSFTFGWGVNEDESFAEVTANILDEKFSSIKVESLNFGVPGYSTFQEAALFEDRGLDFSPDAVVVFFVSNDFGLPFFIKNVHSPGSVVTSTEFARSVWSKKDELVNDQDQDLQEWLDPNNALFRLARLLKKRGIPLFLAINPNPKWKKDLKRLRVVRKNKWIQLVKMRKSFLRIMNNRGYRAADLSLPNDPHPSAIKHKILGAVLAGELFPSVLQYSEITDELYGKRES